MGKELKEIILTYFEVTYSLDVFLEAITTTKKAACHVNRFPG
jgi:hypothetical protein